MEYPGHSLKVALGILGLLIFEFQAGIVVGVNAWRWNIPAWLHGDSLPVVLLCLNAVLLVVGFVVAVKDVNRGAPQWSTSLACVLLLLAACPNGWLLFSMLVDKK